MSSPQAFTIHRAPAPAREGWAIRDRRTEQLWLPLVGPTPYATLLLVDRELEEQTEYFAHVTLRVVDVAERIGVKVQRAFQSVLRLERHHLIGRDPETDTFEHPVFVVDRSVRPVGELEWPRLPAGVRARFAELELRPAEGPSART